MDVSSRKLASGARIGVASDDAAGLSIGQNLMKQYRGLVQANRNAMDGLSLLNTAEGALQEIHLMLNRGRELALQAANGTLTDADRTSIQTEVGHIAAEIDRIADTTSFNGRKLFIASGQSSSLSAVVYGARSGWLEQAANLVNTFYGLQGDGTDLKIELTNNGTQAAWISGTPTVDGVLDNLTLHINLTQFGSEALAGGIPMSDDRKVARALTQAIMARSTAYANLPQWFVSGTADYIAGMDDQLDAAITTHGINAVVNALTTPWVDDELHRASAYLAVKYLDARMPPGALKDMMAELSLSGGGALLSVAMANHYGVPLSDFYTDFQSAGPGGGADFASTLLLNDAAVGGVNNQDDQGAIPDGGTYTEQPLTPEFNVNLQVDGLFDPLKMVFQVGAGVNDQIEVAIPHVSALSLGLLGLDVTKRAEEAITAFTKASSMISTARSQLGSVAGRLEVTIRANAASAEDQISSYSRITDLDFAKEMTSFTRHQILLSSSSAALAQANAARQNVRWLLNGMGGGSRASPLPGAI